jgi:hypothetical protein
VKPAVILNRTGRLEDDAGLGIRPYHYILGSVSGSRGVGHDILVHPFNCIADMGGDLTRRVGDLRHPNLDLSRDGTVKCKHEQGRSAATPNADKVRPIGSSYFSFAATCSACC